MKNFLTRRNEGDGFFNFGAFDELDDFFKPFAVARNNRMNTDVTETEKGYELAIDMPGFEKKDISVKLEKGYLTVEAAREEKEEKNYLRRERSFSCSRSYYVGDNVTEEDITAKYDNGTLRLEVPKKEQKKLPDKKIEIQ